MRTFYGVSKTGAPYRRTQTKMFGTVVFKRVLALREECDSCHEDFWVWPDNPQTACAKCRYDEYFNIPKLEV